MPITKLDWKTVNPGCDLIYEEPASKNHENKSVRVQFKDSNGKPHPIYIQMPPVVLKFGIEEKEIPTAQNPNAKKYYAPLTFPTVRKDSEGNYICDPEYKDQLGFINFIHQLDEANLAVSHMNVKPWFNKPMKKEVLEELYYKNLRKPKEEEKFSPTFSTKLMYNNDKQEFTTKFVDKKGNPITFQDVVKGATVIPLIKTTGLWFAGKSYGMSFQIAQLMVIKTPDSLNELAIEYNDPDEQQDESDDGIGIEYSDESGEGQAPKRQRTD